MTITPSPKVSVVQAARLLATHLTVHTLPEPALLELFSQTRQTGARVQVCPWTVHGIAAELLTWADTLTTVTVQSWRPPDGDRVHLSMDSTLSDPAGTVKLTIFGGADHDPALVGALASGEHRAVTLGELRTWAADASHLPTNGEEVAR
ncbi:MAG: hypothetical protein ACRDQX_03920 [Pseudonocardiaceae bacterium]